MIEVEVKEVTYSPNQNGYMVVLQEKEGERWLPIFIGPAEAQSIAVNLRGGQYLRPMTFDLVSSMLRALDGNVRRVEITRLSEETYFAEVLLERPDGERIRLDARPSDGIPLALRLGLPIHVAQSVMDAAGQSGFPQMVSLEDRILQMEQELADLVAREAFEDAARLRDQIKYYRNLLHPEDEGATPT